MRPRIIKARDVMEPLVAWRPEAPQQERLVVSTGPTLGETVLVDHEAVAREARERGLTEGMRTAEQAYREKLSRLDAMMARLQEERTEFFDRMEPELVRLSVAIAEKIVGHELALRPDVVVDIVRAAMRRLRDREDLRVSVNPGDVERVRAARDDLIGAVDGVRKLEIVEDRRVSIGGCVIESQNGTLDGRIETQLAEVSAALDGAMPGGLGDDNGSEA